jgi:glycosyltransferase involved in cell wall biosynthesis
VFHQIRTQIAHKEYDLVDAHYAYPDGVAAQYLARNLKRPFVVSVRGSDINVIAQFPKRRRLIQSMLREADAIIAVSAGLANAAQRLGAEARKVHIIPNGIDTKRFFPVDRQAARKKLGWPCDTQVVLSVGRLSPVKGFDLLIKAIRWLRDQNRCPMRCYIVGEGELQLKLQREITKLGVQREITLAGPVSPQELPLWYSAANIFCLLSHTEGCPNVVLESLACGTPVVATAVGGIPDMVQDGVTGLLIGTRSVDDVASGIARALNAAWNPHTLTASPSIQDWSDVAMTQAHVYRSVLGES